MAQDEDVSSNRTWQEVAKELTREQDTEKLAALAQELNRLMVEKEKQKVLQRLGPRLKEQRSA